MKRILIAAVMLGAVGSSLLAQPQRATQPKASIQGIVLGADTGQPLRRARVSLVPAGQRGPRAPEQGLVAVTGADGRFSFPVVSPGNYRLMADRNGYLRQEYGQRNYQQRGTPLTVNPGQNLNDLLFRLIRAGVISGRVYDEEGEPVARAQVRVLRYAYERGRRNLVPAGNGMTNDLGEYRVFDLPPGRYYLSATGRMDRGPAGRFAGAPVEGVDEEAYAPVFFPGTTDPARAQPIALDPGQQISGIDFQLVPGPTIHVRGVVMHGVTGQPLRGAQVYLLPREAAAMEFGGRNQAVTNEQGAFDVRTVVTGPYSLLAFSNENEKMLVGRLPVEVGSTDLDGMSITVFPGLDLSGKVQIEGNESAQLDRLRIVLRPRDLTPFFGGGAGPVTSDGRFQMQNLVEDVYSVNIGGAGEGLYLKSVRVGGEEVIERGLTVARGRQLSAVEITLSAAGGRLEGLALGEDGLPAEATVALVPEIKRRNQSHLFKTARTDQLGRFSLQGIAPGTYKIFALEEMEAGALEDAEFLKTMEERGVALQVAENSVQTIEVKRIPANAARP